MSSNTNQGAAPNTFSNGASKRDQSSDLTATVAEMAEDLKTMTKSFEEIDAATKETTAAFNQKMKIHYECSLCRGGAGAIATKIPSQEAFRKHLVECHGVDGGDFEQVAEIEQASVKSEVRLR